MFSNFLYWQFVTSTKYLYDIVLKIIIYLYNIFSIKYLIKTLFAPWKRDVVYYPNPSIRDYFNIFWENFVSRFIGFSVRSVTIISGLLIMFLSIIIGGLIIVVWFLLPEIIIILLFFSIKYIFYV